MQAVVKRLLTGLQAEVAEDLPEGHDGPPAHVVRVHFYRVPFDFRLGSFKVGKLVQLLLPERSVSEFRFPKAKGQDAPKTITEVKVLF